MVVLLVKLKLKQLLSHHHARLRERLWIRKNRAYQQKFIFVFIFSFASSHIEHSLIEMSEVFVYGATHMWVPVTSFSFGSLIIQYISFDVNKHYANKTTCAGRRAFTAKFNKNLTQNEVVFSTFVTHLRELLFFSIEHLDVGSSEMKWLGRILSDVMVL